MIKCIVPVSGGKDSQACLKLAVNHFKPEEVLGLFCDTKWEHPLTYNHINELQKLYNVKIIKISEGNVPDKVRQHRRFPGFSIRFCTSQLKIIPTKKFLKEFATENIGGVEVWYGIRSEESPARAKRYLGKISTELYAPHEVLPRQYPKYLAKLGVTFRLPILDWSADEVYDLLKDEINPLYKKGFKRVGCFPCLAGSDNSKKESFEFDDFGKSQYKIVHILEQEIGKSVYQKNHNNNQGCMICQI